MTDSLQPDYSITKLTRYPFRDSPRYRPVNISQTCNPEVKPNANVVIVDAGRAAGGGSPGRRAACRRASADHRPGDSEGEAEAGGEEAAMAAKRIGGSGARGWGGS